MNYKLITKAVGPLACNCSIISCLKTLDTIVVDPGGDVDFIQKYLLHNSLKLIKIIHTHAHFDHCLATKALVELQNNEVMLCLHKEDLFMYDNLEMQLKLFGINADSEVLQINNYLQHEQDLIFGENKFKVLHTPGHSPGSCSFLLQDDKSILFSGDTIFSGGIGRSDLWGGDGQMLIKSIKNNILTLDLETVIIPGHGPSTSVEIEKSSNPFLN